MSQSLAARYRIGNFIDTFALGHYARVMDAGNQLTGETVAFKVMRGEHLAPDGRLRWEYRAFGNEAQILQKLAESPQAVDLLDCGFIDSDGDQPHRGEIVAHGLNVEAFVDALEERSRKRWRPWLALRNLPRTRNLLYLMKPNQSGIRRRLPSEEGIALALQFASMLRLAHQQDVVYLDHKLEHVYWDGTRLQVIDFNSSRQLESMIDANQQFRTDIHNLCVGILYPVFTGLSPRQGSLRPQPGTLNDVEGRYSDIRELDFGVEPTLSPGIRSLLQRGAAHELATVDEFLEAVQEAGAALGRDFPAAYASVASRDARDRLCQGLSELRGGQEQLRAAREHFREAAILEGISEDMELELRRLVKSVTDMLNRRVIP
ncbi:MAG: hypothetical protein OXG07_02805 [Anaerolineaceae bacterium]|nr:hypothetical protein [Anaerolineaceae bacterium]MCY3907209.1 hypothetical protein [Anaerolineaceae bacterium]MCY3946135.1 hypothetical protein [Anaerolineaceae bacterium]MCY4023643.1 hypothetical protein [Anaerolineaceae bacterium]